MRREKLKGIRFKLILWALLPVVFFLILNIIYIKPVIRDSIYENKKTQVQDMITSGIGVLEYYHQKEKEGELSRNEAQNQAVEIIKSMNYGEDNHNYYFIIDHEPDLVFHPYRPDLKEEDLSTITVSEDVSLFEEFVSIAREQESDFMEYEWQYFDDEERMEPKLSYINNFGPWEWVIGTGVYIYDIDKIVSGQQQVIYYWSFIIALLIIIIFTVFSRSINKPLSTLIDSTRKISKGNYNLQLPKKLVSRSDQIGTLTEAFKDMNISLEQTMDELKESKNKLATTLNSIADGVIATDLEGNITRMNQVAEDLTGWTFEEADGEPFEKVFHIVKTDTGERVNNPVQRVLKEGEIIGLANDTTLIAKDGARYQIIDGASPIIDDDEIMGVVVVFSDITDEYETRRMLKESEKRYRELTERVNAILWEYNFQKDKWTYVPPQVKNITGYKPEEWKDFDFWEKNIHPDDREKVVNKRLESTKKSEEYSLEYRFLKKNGDIIWLKDDISVEIMDGNPVFLRGVMTDISRRKKIEQKLNQVVEEQELLLNNIEIQVWYLKNPEIHEKVNKARAKFMNKSKEEIEGSSYYELYPEEKDAEICIQRNKEVFEKKEKIKSETEVVNGKGEKRILSVTKIPKLDENGNVEYVICSAIDVTEQKKKENKIKYIGFHDNLTGLYNRSFFEEEIERLDVKRQLPLSLIMADVNGLKLVNDTYGHDKGDQLLQKSAEILENSCREEDIIARWGGDEFVILLPRTKKEDAQKIYSRIKTACDCNSQIEEGDKKIPVSIALGTAVKNNKNENIYQVLQKAEDRMYDNKRTESRSAKSNILKTLLDRLEKKSNETREHTRRIKNLALAVGKKIDLPSSELDRLSMLATLHDIGKILISEEILNKEGKLTEEEWRNIEKHPETGNHIVSSIQEFAHIGEEILAHHEHWDGSGYPRGLKGKEIPLLSRIIAIVDAFDIMTNGRPYKKPLTKKEALVELQKCAGQQFDPRLVDKFIEFQK